MDETRELLRLTKEGDEDAREKIVVNNMGLIWSVVKRFTNRGYDPEDLFQIGSIGLLKAVDYKTHANLQFCRLWLWRPGA